MKEYHLPDGPSMARSFMSSFKMVTRPIEVISGNMDKYGDTYGVRSGRNQHIIITRDPGFIEHVLKKKHSLSYSKFAFWQDLIK